MGSEIVAKDALSPGGNLEAYIANVNAIPVLSREREDALARRLHEHGDVEAARELVLGHLRFVVFVAKSYSGYGLAEADIIQEGNVGLMKAVRRFNPNYGVRLVSFAVHWIKAEIHEFILRNWRIVKIATTKPQRKLFFNLRKMRQRLGWMTESEVAETAEQLGVAPEDVRQMESRLAAQDPAFDSDDDNEDDYAPAQFLSDPDSDPALIMETLDGGAHDQERLRKALGKLDERSREIIHLRWLSDEKATLHELADKFDISAERVRQVEHSALKKLRHSFRT